MLNPIPKILAAALAVTVIAALWYRSEAATSSAEAASWKAASEQLVRNAAASEKAATYRRTVADRRKEQHDAERKQDNEALAAHPDWATQPVPDAILERLRKNPVGSPRAPSGSPRQAHN